MFAGGGQKDDCTEKTTAPHPPDTPLQKRLHINDCIYDRDPTLKNDCI